MSAALYLLTLRQLRGIYHGALSTNPGSCAGHDHDRGRQHKGRITTPSCPRVAVQGSTRGWPEQVRANSGHDFDGSARNLAGRVGFNSLVIHFLLAPQQPLLTCHCPPASRYRCAHGVAGNQSQCKDNEGNDRPEHDTCLAAAVPYSGLQARVGRLFIRRHCRVGMRPWHGHADAHSLSSIMQHIECFGRGV